MSLALTAACLYLSELISAGLPAIHAGVWTWPCACYWKPVATLATRKASDMRTIGHIPLRFLHSQSANFTLPIHKKPIATTLLPFSLKKISGKSDKLASERPHVH
jgi:hypothetical protein